VIAGIFIGGASRRMGGRPKALLPAPDGSGTLVERTARVAAAASLAPVLVGRNDEVARILPDLEVVEDRPGAPGPLGGLAALLSRADGARAIALPCDMPALGPPLLRRLVEEAPAATLLAPRDARGRWQPFFSRWDPALLREVERAIAAGARSLQPLFAAHATPLSLDEAGWRALRDWDTPADVGAG